jgi:hypothetical protein
MRHRPSNDGNETALYELGNKSRTALVDLAETLRPNLSARERDSSHSSLTERVDEGRREADLAAGRRRERGTDGHGRATPLDRLSHAGNGGGPKRLIRDHAGPKVQNNDLATGHNPILEKQRRGFCAIRLRRTCASIRGARFSAGIDGDDVALIFALVDALV